MSDTPRPPSDPFVELAPLPREQVGPFVILGVPKGADADTIEAHWAQRVIAARKGQTKTPLEDIHWAREQLRDPERRAAADAGSLNLDIAKGEIAQIIARYHIGDPCWPAMDPEPEVAAGSVEWPDPVTLAADVPAPPIPIELPGVMGWVDRFATQTVDPWGLDLGGPRKEPAGDA